MLLRHLGLKGLLAFLFGLDGPRLLAYLGFQGRDLSLQCFLLLSKDLRSLPLITVMVLDLGLELRDSLL